MSIRNYHCRKKIIETLGKYQDGFPIDSSIKDIALPFSKLKELLHYKGADVYLLDTLQMLVTEEEVYCNLKYDKSDFALIGKGRAAYRENKYGKLEWKAIIDLIYERLKVASMLILLLLAIYSFLQNFRQTHENSQKIKEIETRLNSLNK